MQGGAGGQSRGPRRRQHQWRRQLRAGCRPHTRPHARLALRLRSQPQRFRPPATPGCSAAAAAEAARFAGHRSPSLNFSAPRPPIGCNFQRADYSFHTKRKNYSITSPLKAPVPPHRVKAGLLFRWQLAGSVHDRIGRGQSDSFSCFDSQGPEPTTQGVCRLLTCRRRRRRRALTAAAAGGSGWPGCSSSPRCSPG